MKVFLATQLSAAYGVSLFIDISTGKARPLSLLPVVHPLFSLPTLKPASVHGFYSFTPFGKKLRL